MQLRNIQNSDDKILFDIVRHNLKIHDLDIPGTVYFDPELKCLSSFYLADPFKRKYWVLEKDGEVLGGIGLAEYDQIDDCCEIQKLYLIDRVKGQGFGKLLVQEIEKTAKELGYKRIYVETHTNLDIAIKLYKKMGYTPIDKPKTVVHSAMNCFLLKDLNV